MDVKLPKQWNHWARKAGLRPQITRGKSKRDRYLRTHHLIGHGRLWRVNDKGHFQSSCKVAEFDRWANSVDAEIDYIPRTYFEFRIAVQLLQHGISRYKHGSPHDR